MPQALFSIARFTLLEGRRTRLPWLTVVLIVLAYVLAEFAAALAITDSAAFRVGFYAAFVRVVLVSVVILFVCASVLREFSDRMLDLTLARPVSRASWFGGRLLGAIGIALALALAASLPLWPWSAPARVAAWSAALGAELAVVATVALACVVTLRLLLPSVLACGAFYLLARSLDALLLMSQGPTVDPTAWSNQVIAFLLQGLALLLPALDRVAASTWLSADGALPALAPLVLELAVFGALVGAIGLIDFYRVDE